MVASDAGIIITMESGFTDISWAGLAWSLIFIALVLALSFWQKLDLERRLLIGCVRTILQLLAIGYVLGWIFNSENIFVVLVAISLQLVAAIWAVGTLLKPPIKGARLVALVSLAPAYAIIAFALVALIIRPSPWWEPRLVLPLGGMLLGNAVSAIALALNRYVSDQKANRDSIFARLSLGATWPQALVEERQAAAYAAMLPSITALVTVGLVSLPGMMSGQIIAGLNPLSAVRYQIVVMFMIAAVAGISTSIALALITRRGYFEPVPE